MPKYDKLNDELGVNPALHFFEYQIGIDLRHSLCPYCLMIIRAADQHKECEFNPLAAAFTCNERQKTLLFFTLKFRNIRQRVVPNHCRSLSSSLTVLPLSRSLSLTQSLSLSECLSVGDASATIPVGDPRVQSVGEQQ